MDRKEIRLKFIGFWPGFNEYNNIYVNTIKQKFEVVITDDPDYVIATMYCSPFEITKYNNCIRIFHSGEDYFPDMNIYDYAAGYDDFNLKGITEEGFIDRYFRWPFGCEWDLQDIKHSLAEKSLEDSRKILKKKNKFCNFIYGHESYLGQRELLFESLSKYKPVDSAGIYKNNMLWRKVVPYRNKIEFLKKYKFTIAAETLRYPGMVTEKIYDAYRANSIPIYFGDPCIGKWLDTETFIEWDGSNTSIQKIIEKVKELDNDDDLYVEMIMKNKTRDNANIDCIYKHFSEWLLKIFTLDRDDAMQHIKIGGASQREVYEKHLSAALYKQEAIE